MASWFHTLLPQTLGLASPFCPLYVTTAAASCGFWLFFSQQWTWRQVFRYSQQKFRENRRAIYVDGLWAVFQVFFLRFPVALLHITLFEWSYEQVLEAGGDRFGIGQAPELVEAFLATMVTMLAIDLAAYGMHRAMHSLSGLWWIHRIHHQARFLTPFSTFRQNPLEPFLLNGARGLAAGVALGILHALLPNSTPVWTIGGMGLGFFLYMFTVNLHHAPIPVRYPRIFRSILISPHIHHLHHSRAAHHLGKNFGVVFSFWDRIFGSYLDQEFELDELEFGLDSLGS